MKNKKWVGILMAFIYGLGSFLFANIESIIPQKNEIKKIITSVDHVQVTYPIKKEKQKSINDSITVASQKSGCKEDLNQALHKLYSSIGLEKTGLNFTVFHNAMIGYYNLKSRNYLSNKEVLTIIDMEKHSKEKRFFLIDLKKKKLLYNTFVSHGKGSGNTYAKTFSNRPNSNMTSLGFYVTDKPYLGKHGVSLYLNGMEKGYNDNARKRSIVIHTANYINENIVKRFGSLGRSLGCPALPDKNYKEIISLISDQTALYISYPDKKYLEESTFLNENSVDSTFFNKMI